MIIEITDNSGLVGREFEAACLRALEKCGLVAEGYAKRLQVPDTGLLRNSITHALAGQNAAITEYKANKGDKKGYYRGTAPKYNGGEMAVYIGSNVEYAAYVELGTGKYYPGGRPTPWVYQDAKGEWHMTHGQRAQPYLKPAVADHAGQYKQIIENELKGG